MSYKTTTYKVLIASPSDVTSAREAIPEAIYRWNSINSDFYKVTLLPVKWETDTAPEAGESPQEIINRQMVKDCDILIGIFWTRIGTKTKKAESGTVEEITHFIKENKPTMIYFSSEPIEPDKIDLKQKKRLDEFKTEIEKIALIESYENIDDLKEKIDRQLTKTIKDVFINPKPIIYKKSIGKLDKLNDSKKKDKPNTLFGKSLLLLSNIENKLQPKIITENIFSDFLYSINNNLAILKPDISLYKDKIDEAIINQINSAIPINRIFIEASMIASKSKNLFAIKTIYNYFGELLKLCKVPEGFSGSYSESDFDGYRFLVYEMFVAFLACLIKYNNWEIIGEMLSYDLFIGRNSETYIPFSRINKGNYSLDVFRNQRLKLQRISVVSDILKERFENSNLSQLLTHKEFMEADYFLYLKSFYLHGNLWCPRSCVYLHHPPIYLLKSESNYFLSNFIKALNLDNKEDLGKLIKDSTTRYGECFRGAIFLDNPLEDFEIDKLGTRN